MMTRWRVALLFGAALFACAPEGGGGRDVVPPSRDVIVDGGGPARPAEGYDYVARRLLAVVALAEARGIAAALARDAVDRVADALGSCIAERQKAGLPADGAARVVVQVDPSGAVAGASVRVDPGAGAAAGALLCLVTPVKLLVFPAVDAGARGFAIEALWGRLPVAP